MNYPKNLGFYKRLDKIRLMHYYENIDTYQYDFYSLCTIIYLFSSFPSINIKFFEKSFIFIFFILCSLFIFVLCFFLFVHYSIPYFPPLLFSFCPLFHYSSSSFTFFALFTLSLLIVLFYFCLFFFVFAWQQSPLTYHGHQYCNLINQS